MSIRRILSIALLAGLLGTSAACADITAPQNEFCPVSGSGQTCGT